MASLGAGPQGGQALYSPSYIINKYQKTYDLDALTNGPVEFQRIIGPQRFVMNLFDGTYTYIFSFSLTGGTNRPVASVLPMFPNTTGTYSPSINFTMDPNGITPVGCTVQMRPIPTTKTSTRINIFDITETLSGSSYEFCLRMCPFMNINSTIELTGPALPDGSLLTVYSEFFRVRPNLRTGGIPISFMYPSYKTRMSETLITPVDSVNPLDNPTTKIPFTSFAGQQTIVFVNYVTGYYFMLDIDYGIIGQAGGYMGWVSPTANGVLVPGSTPIGGTIESVFVSSANTNSVSKMARLKITSPVGDGGGREYLIDIFPSTIGGKKPTINLSSGAPIGDEEVGVKIYGRYFSMV
jgi:hypothetical protein